MEADEELSPPTRNVEEGRGEPGGARDVKSGSEKKRSGGRAIGNSGMAGGAAGEERMVEGRGAPMPPLCTLQGCCNLPYLVGGLRPRE